MPTRDETALLRTVIDNFHKVYYQLGTIGAGTWRDTAWFGVPLRKCPLDLWVYQEILFETRPARIIETGTFRGGSALFLAHLCDLLGHGEVLTVDIERQDVPRHDRITYLTGSSVDHHLLEQVKAWIQPADTVMAILDSDHSRNHVLKEMMMYGPLVSPGHYLIVEDTNINGHPVAPEFGPGPMEAVDEYRRRYDDFEVDPGREKFLMTQNPRGYLRKKSADGARPGRVGAG